MFVKKNRANKTRNQAHDYDIVVGPIADDDIGMQMRRFNAGIITIDEFLENLNYKIPCSGVISRPAASTSCRSFFITSAGIHLRSTLTVRTRLRLRTMSIGA